MRLLLITLLFTTLVQGQPPVAPTSAKPMAATDPAQTDADFAIQGEYTGTIDEKAYGVQIWAQGGGKFEAVSYAGERRQGAT